MLRSLINSNLIYYLRINLDGYYTFTNNYFNSKFAHLSPKFINTHFSGSIHPDDTIKCKDAVIYCLNNPESSIEVDIRKPYSDGTYFHTSWEFSLYQDPNKSEVEIQCIGFDFTKKQAQIQSIIENLPDSVFVVDKNGICLDIIVSHKSHKLEMDKLGIGKHFDIVTPNKSISIMDFIEQTDQVGDIQGIKYYEEFKNKKKWFIANLSSLVYDKEKCFLWVSRDITQIVDYQIKIEAQNKKMSEIAQLNSHQTRAPIARILGLASILEIDSLSEKNNQIIQYVKEASIELDKIVTQVSKLSDLSN